MCTQHTTIIYFIIIINNLVAPVSLYVNNQTMCHVFFVRLIYGGPERAYGEKKICVR